jgi:tetratricopeptide (TPR) repeat protein
MKHPGMPGVALGRALCCAAAGLFLVAAARAGNGDLLQEADLARQAYDAGHWEDARQRYVRLAERAPGNTEIRFRLGNVHARLGQLDEAAASFQELLAHQPAYPKGWHNLAVVRLYQAMAALGGAQREGAPGEAMPSRRLLEALEAALGGSPPPVADCQVAAPSAPEPAAPPTLAAYTAARVKLRQGCGIDYPVLATLPVDVRVEVLARPHNCAQVMAEDGQTGWIPLSLLRLAPLAEGK